MKIYLSAALLLCSLVSVSQTDIDILSIAYRYGIPRSIEGEQGDATENILFTNLKVPVPLKKDLSRIWYNDITYQYSHVAYDGDPANTLNPTKLHGIILQTGLVQRLSEDRAFQLLLVPRLMSDFKNIDKKHFQLGGIGMFEKRYSNTFMARYGVMYNRERFGHMFVPLVYLDWQLSDKLSVVGLFPIFGKVKYQVSDRFSAGISHFGLITSYQLGDELFRDDYIERKSIDLTLFSRYRVFGNVHLETRLGYALGRSYEQYADGDEVDFRVTILTFGDDREQKNRSFDPGPILDVRLVYNVRLDKN